MFRIRQGLVDFGHDAAALALQPDGRIVLIGTATVDPENEDVAVARLMPNGSLDRTFGSGGRSLVSFQQIDAGSAVALQSDGKIVLAGSTNGRNPIDSFGGGLPDFALARLQPNGLLDSTFGRRGKSLADFFSGSDLANDLALQRDGKFLIAGNSFRSGPDPSSFAMARFRGDPGGVQGPQSCAGRPATVVGTRAADRLKGTRRRDVIVAGRGKDSVRAGSGPDLVCMGSGNDKALGGGGNDRLYGGAGKDKLSGGRGRDRLFGGSGNDSINVRDGRRDRVDCGGGRRDRVRADNRDRLRHCEHRR